jgi:hypothetical protein
MTDQLAKLLAQKEGKKVKVKTKPKPVKSNIKKK